MIDRQRIYRDLGRQPKPRPVLEQPAVSSATQHVLSGMLDTSAQYDITYVCEPTIRFRIGSVFMVLKGREAVLSARELVAQLAPLIDELFPDLDAEQGRQQRAIADRKASMRASRARVNGSSPAAARMRQAAEIE